MSTKKERRTFSDEFKSQIVQLFNAGKSKSDICREYDLAPAVVDRWIKRINATGSAKECDNRTQEEIELMKLRKENKRLLMENDILKQAALIFAQR